MADAELQEEAGDDGGLIESLQRSIGSCKGKGGREAMAMAAAAEEEDDDDDAAGGAATAKEGG
jgi:hypothetical protein